MFRCLILCFGFFVSVPAFADDLRITVGGQVTGQVIVDLFDDIAPNHTQQIRELANMGAYNGVVFHRVINGFMAQTGDVLYGVGTDNLSLAGRGGSDLPDLGAEFSEIPFARGIVGMARAQDPNSANSQFFIMFAPGFFLNGQYTVVGKVTEGMELIDQLKKGTGPNGAVLKDPDYMERVELIK